LHGDLEQNQRDEALIEFSNTSRPILVATDVASRGIDIKDIELVINYDTPQNIETYTHRIGRTGRADAIGQAVTLFSKKDEVKYTYVLKRAKENKISDLSINKSFKLQSSLDTLCINGGKKDKLRAGDILGTLCKEVGLDIKDIGKINISATKSYIALDYKAIKKVPKNLKIKKRKFVTWTL